MITVRLKMLLIYILLPAVVGAGLFHMFSVTQTGQWLAPSLSHPLGTDEFGRDIFSSALVATGLSLLKGLGITAITFLSAVAIAELITLQGQQRFTLGIRVASSIVESVPTVLWVMIALIVIKEPRFVVVALAFTLVTLPFTVHILSGELLRLRNEPYVETAYLLGAGELRVLLRYILPSAVAVLAPYAIQVLGMAIAVNGAIGVIGLGSRSDLDLGIFLLRGKENFILHPQILLVALTMYGLIYGYILWVGRRIGRAFHET